MTRHRNVRRALLVAAALALFAAALRATPKDGAKSDTLQPQPPVRPTAEHDGMSRLEGTWDAMVEVSMGAPGTAPQVSKGIETNRRCCGGLWLVTEFRNDAGSRAYEGHGLTGYDPSKKKYVSTWVDSDLTAPMISEGAYDATGGTLTMRGSMTSRGKTMPWRSVQVWKDDDTRLVTMYMRGPDGKEAPGLKIAYTRSK